MNPATVTSVTFKNEWTGQFGTMYTFTYVLHTARGEVVGDANHKTPQSPFNPGDQIEYEIVSSHPQHGDKIKVAKPQQPGAPAQGGYSRPAGGGNFNQGGAKKQPFNSLGATVGCAAHCVSRMVAAGKVDVSDFTKFVKVTTKRLIQIEKELSGWSPEEAPAPATAQTQPQPQTQAQYQQPQQQAPQQQAPRPPQQQPVQQPLPASDTSGWEEGDDMDDIPF